MDSLSPARQIRARPSRQRRGAAAARGWAEAEPSGGARRWREGEEGARARRAPRGGDLLPHLFRRPPGHGRRGGRGLRRPASGDGLRAVDVADDIVHVHGSDAAAAPEAREVRGGSGPGGLRRGRRRHHPRRRHAPPAHGPAEDKGRRPRTRRPARLSLPAALPCPVLCFLPAAWRGSGRLGRREEKGSEGKNCGWLDGRRGSRGGTAARRWPCPEEAARARGAERQRRWWSGREKCDCVLTIGAGEMGTKRKSLFTRGKRQFAFRKCMLLLESVLCRLVCSSLEMTREQMSMV